MNPDSPREAGRLFLALWPDDATRERLAELARRVSQTVDGRRTTERNLHLTLAFLGPVDPERSRTLRQKLTRLPFSPFTLTLDHLGYWPRPQVIWVGRHRPPPPLDALVNRLRAVLNELKLPQDHRPFVPHVTLLRKVHRRPPPREIAPIPWTVRDFVLVESRLTPRGAEYRLLQRWPEDTP